MISGVIPHLVGDGLEILQCADDMILLMDHDFDKATNLKFIVSVFKQLFRAQD